MAERKAKRARAEPAPSDEPAAPKDSPSVSSFLQSWAWKREHRPDRDRFQRPYVHSMKLPGAGQSGDGDVVKLTVEQARFRGAQGFASTVWDSSIVVAKMLERNPDLVAGRAVLDLSAGCGLVALVAARLGACRTVATDLGPNLPLLRRNLERNGAVAVEVAEHWWGEDVGQLLRGSGGDVGSVGVGRAAASGGAPACEAAEAPGAAAAGGEKTAAVPGSPGQAGEAAGRGGGGADGAKGGGTGGGGHDGNRGGGGGSGRLDLVVACDVMYLEEAVGPLVATLAGLCGGKYDPHASDAAGATAAASDATTAAPVAAASASSSSPTLVLLAHGRNRFAEVAFWRHAANAGFVSEAVPWDELDPVYHCTDVDVYRLSLGGGPPVASAKAEACCCGI